MALLVRAPASTALDFLVSRFAAMAAPFVLFALSYEVLFLLCFGAVLFFWLCNELGPRSDPPPRTHAFATLQSGLGARFIRNTIFFVRHILMRGCLCVCMCMYDCHIAVAF